MPAQQVIESTLNDPSLLYAMLGLVGGGVIAWLWRGAEVSKTRGDLEEQRERLQELEIGHASLLSEREILAEQFEKLGVRVTALQQERDVLSSTNAGLSAS